MREIVTFDAYGTLVDFQLGPTTLKVLADRLDLDNLDVDEFLDDFRVMRFQAVLEAYRPYHEILHSSLRMAMRLHGLEYRESDGDALVEAVPTFGPFPEVPDALRALKSRYEIAIITNSDDNLIARNVENIGVEFDYVITAEQAGAYKPDRQTFEHAFKTMGVEPVRNLLHGVRPLCSLSCIAVSPCRPVVSSRAASAGPSCRSARRRAGSRRCRGGRSG